MRRAVSFHQRLLARSARHVRHVQLRRLGEGCVGSQLQAIGGCCREPVPGAVGGAAAWVRTGRQRNGQPLPAAVGTTTASRVPAAVL
jgi:hypothetical protein